VNELTERNPLLFDMMLSRVFGSVIAAIAIAVGCATIIAPMVGASKSGGMFMSCAQLGEVRPSAKRHPHNCFISAAETRQHSGALVLFDFQQILWHRWGSTVAWALADSVNAKAHTHTWVRFSVRGKQVCRGRDYYAKIVLEGLYKRPRRFEMGCGS
jgi:hypothetical protein